MSRFTNRKKWLSGLLAVSLAAVPTCTTSAEENNEIAAQYIIVELEPVSVSESDTAENVSETEQLTEGTVKVESEPNAVLFSLEKGRISDEYSVTGISMDEPIIAQLLAQTADYQDYDTIALYDLISHQQTADEPYDFNLQIPEDADITLYQSVDGQLQRSTLDAAYTEEEYNCLPLISYQSETNHWLVLYLGVNEDISINGTDDSVSETERAAESLEGKTEQEESDTTAAASDIAVTNAPATAAPNTAAPTKTPETQPQTTAHTHAWVPVTKVVHHDATYKDVWVQDSAAWDENTVTKEAWDEQVLVQDAYDENVLVQDEYDEPIYDWVDICNACGHKFLESNDDINEHMAAGCWSSWHAEWLQVGTTHHDAVYQTVHHDAVYQIIHHEAETTTIHHDATGHTEKAVDQAAWDETVITGYTCSGCGATKEK